MSYQQGLATPEGKLNLKTIYHSQPPLYEILKRGLPSKRIDPIANQWRISNLMNFLKGARKVWIADKLGVPFAYGALYLTIVKPVIDTTDLMREYADLYPTLNRLSFTAWASAKGIPFKYLPLGLASTRVVTTVGVNFIVDAFQNIVEVENLKYHGIGTGSTAEAVGDTALVTELTTEYNPNSTRATGTTTEGASANIYRTVGTNTLDGTPGAALREHGIFDQASTAGGTLLDRTVFAAITLSSGDGLSSTYDLTLTAGS